MKRREFIKLTAAGATAAFFGAKTVRSESNAPPEPVQVPATLIGMPISVAPLVQRDLDRIFADMQQRAGVNALFPFIYTHELHRSGAPAAGFHGGNYGTPHMEYYRDTPLTYEDMRAPEFGPDDILARVVAAGTRHGIKTFPFLLEDNIRPALVPHWEALYEVDHHGRRADRHPGGPCFNNPGYQNFTLGLVEDYARSYEIGGIMWGSERQSGLLNALGLSQSSGQDPGRATCFCAFCEEKGRQRGIDVGRARQGFGAVEKFVQAGRTGARPRDGFFTAFWRLVLDYPEVLAWARLWVDSRHEFQAALYRRIKSINPALKVGWHVWHNVSFSPFQRAEEDFSRLAGYADFLRPALYNHAAGERFLRFVQGAHGALLGDLTPPEICALLYRQLNYQEAPYEHLGATGWSADYVERETRRAVDDVAGNPTEIWPGVDIDVPTGPTVGRVTPESVGEAVKAVFRGGARGIILSRNYVEMKPENLSGAGAALRELGRIGKPA